MLLRLDQVGPKIGEGSFAVVHKGKEVHGQQRNVAIKIVRSEEELGLGDDDGDGGVSYKDVLRSMRMEMETMEVRVVVEHPPRSFFTQA